MKSKKGHSDNLCSQVSGYLVKKKDIQPFYDYQSLKNIKLYDWDFIWIEVKSTDMLTKLQELFSIEKFSLDNHNYILKSSNDNSIFLDIPTTCMGKHYGIKAFISNNIVISMHEDEKLTAYILKHIINKNVFNAYRSLLYITSKLLMSVKDHIIKTEMNIEYIEKKITNNSLAYNNSKIRLVRHDLIFLYKAISSLNTISSTISLDYDLEEREAILFDKLNTNINSAANAIDNMRYRTAIISNEIESNISKTSDKRTYLLSIITFICLPVGLVMNLFNLHFMENSPSITFGEACFILLAISLILAIILKIFKWI